MKLFEKLLTVLMIVTISLMFIRFVAPVSATLIFILALITLGGVIIKVLDEPKKTILSLFMWIFIAIMWGLIANKDMNDNQKMEEKESTEIIYRT
jgi:di/tricarboxylate transporter